VSSQQSNDRLLGLLININLAALGGVILVLAVQVFRLSIQLKAAQVRKGE
jgi:hypothetical protein